MDPFSGAEMADFIATLRAERVLTPFAVVETVSDCDRFARLRVDGDCPARCKGGFVFSQDEHGYELSHPCPRCSPVYQHARRFNAARLPVWAHRVERDWSGVPWSAVVATAAEIIGGTRNVRVWYGDPGRGKSFIACAVALEALKAGLSVSWVTWPTLLDDLRDQMRDGKALRTLVDPLARVDLLVVDEVKGKATPFSADVAESLIGRRAELGRRVVCTANLSEPELWACLGDRVRSRIAQAGRVKEIQGTDRRAK